MKICRDTYLRRTKMNKKLKIAGSILAGVALLGGAYSAGHLMANPEPLVVEKVVVSEKLVNVTVPGPVQYLPGNVTEVPVEDESFLKLVCERNMYDDLLECKEEIKAEDAALALAFTELKAELANELEDADLVEDERDVRIVKVYSDFEDLEVTDSDFDSNEYEFEIKVKVEDEDADEKFEVLATVEVSDGEAKVTDVELI